MSSNLNPDIAEPYREPGLQHAAPEPAVPAELGRAGAVIGKTIEYMVDQNIGPLAIASALLGGSLELMARTMDEAAVLRVLDNARACVRAGELRCKSEG
jgi:hypothetical protein